MSKFTVNKDNNFIRIFRLPQSMPSDFCFGGGHKVEFQLVDWFNPVCDPEEPLPAMLEGHNLEELRGAIKAFIKPKIYFNPAFTFLAITDYGDSFLINQKEK